MNADQPAAAKRAPIKRFLPLILLLAAVGAVFALGLDDYLSFEALRAHRLTLLGWVEAYGVLAGIGYMLIYTAAVAVSVPGAVFLTLAGGFLFGAALGTLYTVIGATAGAALIFLIAKTALGDSLRRRAGPFVQKMADGFQANGFNYLLSLRLVPLFPFWLVNLVPALLGMRLSSFVAATALGIIPGSFVFSLAGAGLGSVFDSGDSFSVSGVLTPTMIAALIGLALLSLLPIAYRKWKGAPGE